MRVATILALSLPWLIACDSGPCQQPKGSYRVAVIKRSGNCTAGSGEFIANTDSPDANDGWETLSSVFDPSTCKTTLERGYADSAGTIRGTLFVDWNAAATEATGLMDMTGSGGYSCHGTYDVTYTKL